MGGEGFLGPRDQLCTYLFGGKFSHHLPHSSVIARHTCLLSFSALTCYRLPHSSVITHHTPLIAHHTSLIACHTCLSSLATLACCHFVAQSLPFLSFLCILPLLLSLLWIKVISLVLAVPPLFKVIRESSPHNLPTPILVPVPHKIFHPMGPPLLHHPSLSLFPRISSIR